MVNVLEIRKLRDGGYLVSGSRWEDSPHHGHSPFVFASTTIDEAVKYIKSQLEPKEKK